MNHVANPSSRRLPAAPASVALAALVWTSLAGSAARAQPDPDTPPSPPAPAANPAPAAPVAPPGVRQMRLSEVLEVTLARETSLEQATIDVRIADAAVLEAAGIDDWLLGARAGWSRSVSFFDQPISGTATSNAFSGSLDLSRSLSTGGTVSLHGDARYTSFQTVYDMTIPGVDESEQTRFTDNVTVGFRQPLLRGRGEKYARSGQALAEMDRDAASFEREAVATQAISEVVSAYWEIAYAWRDLAIRRASLALAEAQLRNTRARIDAGAVAPTEALAVEQIIASREEAILNAELNVTNRSLTLRSLSGLEIGPGELDLWSEAPVTITPRTFDTNALLARAFERSPTLAALEVHRSQLALQVELAGDDELPSLDLDLAFGPTGSGDGPGEALESTVKFKDITFSAGLTLEHSLGARTARGRTMNARERVARLAVDVRVARTQITNDLVTAIKQAEVAQQRVALGDRVIALARRNIEAEQARFELGRATNFDVLERQDELEQAQLQRARAVVDYLLAVTAIDALTGDLLNRYGIQLEAVTPES